MELNPLKIRLSTWNTEIINEFCTNYAVRWAYVLEHVNNENHHCHLYIETSKTEVSIRSYIRRTVGSGNDNYSMKKLDSILPMEYFRYLSKQGEIIHNFLTDEQIDYYKNLDIQVKEEIKEKNERKKKSSSKSVIECLREILNQKVVKTIEIDSKSLNRKYTYPLIRDDEGNLRYWKSEEVIQVVIDYYFDNNILVREFQMLSQVQTLMLQYNPSFHSTLHNRLNEKI